MDYFTGGSVIMDNAWYFGESLKLKRLNDGFVYYKHTAFQFTSL